MSDAPVPDLVRRAEQSAAALGFALGCRREVGTLLRTLVASKPGGVMAESGTGTGIGSAWMHAGLSPDARLVTVERDADLATAAQQLLADDPRVHVLHDDWTALRDHAPFDVFFCDGGGKLDAPDLVVSLLAPGGVLVLDDFTPSPHWPPTYDDAPDTLRLKYLEHPDLVATQVDVSTDMTVVLGVRRPRA